MDKLIRLRVSGYGYYFGLGKLSNAGVSSKPINGFCRCVALKKSLLNIYFLGLNIDLTENRETISLSILCTRWLNLQDAQDLLWSFRHLPAEGVCCVVQK